MSEKYKRLKNYCSRTGNRPCLHCEKVRLCGSSSCPIQKNKWCRVCTLHHYFSLSGKYRPLEAVTLYVALSEAGLPVLLANADELRARFEGSDYIGIVPHDTIPKYCESMFPSQYGHVIDFIHVFDEELEKYGKAITWLPEDPADLQE